MTIIAVTAEFQLKADHVDAALTILQSIINPNRKESGCLFYELYRATDQKNYYIMIERWQSSDHLHQHQQSSHITQAAQAIQPYLQKPIVVRSFAAL